MGKSQIRQYAYYLILTVTIILVYRMFYYEGVAGYTFVMGVSALLSYVLMFFRSVHSYQNPSYKIECSIALSTFVTYLVSVALFNQPYAIISRYLIPLSVVPYFFLVHEKTNTRIIENVLITIAILYVLCWLYQLSQLPNIIFGNRAVMESGRGFARFYIATKEHLAFLLFYILSCYMIKKKVLYAVLAFLIYGIIILHVTRQLIVWSGLMALIYIICMNKDKANKKQVILFAAIACIAFVIFTNKFSVLNDILETTKEGRGDFNELGTGNIRFEAMRKFILGFNDSFLTILFGSGYGTEGTNLYYKYAHYEDQGYYISDVGFVGLYVTQGLISVFLYVCLLYKVIFKCRVDKKYFYIKFYIIYIVLSYLGSHAFTSNLILVLLAIYILKKNSLELSNN